MPKLLLITHDAVLAKAYTVRLAKVGFTIEHRPTGHEGLVRARQWTPELILLDLALPGMNGLDVVKSLRDVPWLVKVPVVLLIERTLESTVLDECLLWGATSAFQKDTGSLQDLVTHLTEILQTHPVLSPTPPSSTASPSESLLP